MQVPTFGCSFCMDPISFFFFWGQLLVWVYFSCILKDNVETQLMFQWFLSLGFGSDLPFFCLLYLSSIDVMFFGIHFFLSPFFSIGKLPKFIFVYISHHFLLYIHLFYSHILCTSTIYQKEGYNVPKLHILKLKC